jgi:hypothetical protein
MRRGLWASSGAEGHGVATDSRDDRDDRDDRGRSWKVGSHVSIGFMVAEHCIEWCPNIKGHSSVREKSHIFRCCREHLSLVRRAHVLGTAHRSPGPRHPRLPAHLRPLFWCVRGESPRTTLELLRCQCACELWANPTSLLETVAAAYGLSAASALSRGFRAHTGFSQLAWRQRRLRPESVQLTSVDVTSNCIKG